MQKLRRRVNSPPQAADLSVFLVLKAANTQTIDSADQAAPTYQFGSDGIVMKGTQHLRTEFRISRTL
jgi:hypothetical protein